MTPHWKSFLTLCLKAKSPEELSGLFDCFLTIEEKESIADRYLIIKALLENKLTQRDIAEQFNVSIAKITRGSNALKLMDSKTKSLLEKNIA
ncbi:MAG: Trp operon repressor [Gammaproteobacteria bacterium RIFCSPHIGHO2_12_FULL_38_11]|nr:MAG: Trp operon repressor [Gammaproteobacteria bacterium RIFCSPHIGHO2_12_FULL_38_11]